MQVGLRPESLQSLLNKITTRLVANITAISLLLPQINPTEFQFGEETPMHNETRATVELAEASAFPTLFVAMRTALFYVTLAVTMGTVLLLIHGALYFAFRQRYLDKLARVSKAIYDLKNLPQGALNWSKSCVIVMAQFVENTSKLFGKFSEGFKFLVVNNISTKAFFAIAKILPIGDWLKYETLDFFGRNSLYRAIEETDHAALDLILKITSKSTLYKLLKDKDLRLDTAIDLATFEDECNIEILEKILKAIEPDQIISVLNTILDDHPYPHNLALCSRNVMDAVMKTIPEQDRYTFLSSTDYLDVTPVMGQIICGIELSEIQALLSYCSSQKIPSLFNTIDIYRRTPLTILAKTDKTEILEYVLGIFSETEKKEFFKFQNQGIKALGIAHLNNNVNVIKILEGNGLSLPPNYKNITEELMSEIDKKTQANEKFKKLCGDYPYRILDIPEFETNQLKIRKAFITSSFKCHPDRNSKSDANQEFGKVKNAFEFYSDHEVFQTYLKP